MLQFVVLVVAGALCAVLSLGFAASIGQAGQSDLGSALAAGIALAAAALFGFLARRHSPLGRWPAGNHARRASDASGEAVIVPRGTAGNDASERGSAIVSGTGRQAGPGHAFISYVREDADRVDLLQRRLEAAAIPVWRDLRDLRPGQDWRAQIRAAIAADALVFIACFSSRSIARKKSYQNEELLLAVEQARLRQPAEPWLIPVRLDDCEIPDFELGPGRTLSFLHRADLFGAGEDAEADKLVMTVLAILGRGLSATAGPAE